ncbi:hypothetical protein J5N97_023001 [Dioscorea zingiberensis]|uniref:LisH domain-containing protein n=1 Tax=Dioscorea zingiberensis TaxID=325984 RepID=A0A9D5CBT7_9LILI|nr:hypothetical protein J5N97_022980 [Dioscorea zingiberensis]KAJ0970124.1 hypothetical protein J5N97_023001 [Dioscorea zingiberensis]
MESRTYSICNTKQNLGWLFFVLHGVSFGRLNHYIYDYMIKKNLHASAEAFKNEVDISLGSVGNVLHRDDLIDLNDVFLEDNIEQALFPGEKGGIAKPSSMVLKQGPTEEEDAPKGDGDEITRVG